MESGPRTNLPDHDPLTHIPWDERRKSRFGLQGKLILSFLGLITIALGSSCWLFATQSSEQMSDMIAEQARLVTYTLSLAAEPSMAEGHTSDLEKMGHDLLNTRNILYVAFLDADQKPIMLAKRYVDFSWNDVSKIAAEEQALHLVYPRTSKAYGDYVDVFSPVVGKVRPMSTTQPAARAHSAAINHTFGYVIVGVSLDREQAQLYWVNWIVAGIGLTVVILSLPIAYLLVYGIFKPIRQLVDATRKISIGRLDVRVEIDRDDLIGELANSFDEMVSQVRQQREDLATTNYKLAEANSRLAGANAKLEESNRDLETKVFQRTSQFESANRRLSAEIAEKEDFLRAVSHDLNAPLRNISGMVSMLLSKHKDKFDEEITHRLERVQKNVQVETDLISELLELSRIKTRRQRFEVIDVEAIVRDLSGVFEEDLRSRKIQLTIDTPLPSLSAERTRIRQVFQNLIDNAIKYMGDGATREIHVGSAITPDEIEFYVRDTGIGIEPQDIGKVFHVFRRGRSAAASAIAGKGVGLSSVKSIIETYSGAIRVESTVGQGTTFRFTIDHKHLFDGTAPPHQLSDKELHDSSEDDEPEYQNPEAPDRRAA